VPLALYPPGFDLSGFLIYDPATGESVSGNDYSVKSLSPMNFQGGGMQPLAFIEWCVMERISSGSPME
jgi:hypothetical protein